MQIVFRWIGLVILLSQVVLAISPRVGASVQPAHPLAPGITITQSFTDVSGNRVTLPTEGRYLLWSIDAAFALETRAQVPNREFADISDENFAFDYQNPTVHVPDFGDFGTSIIIFFEDLGPLPFPDERAEVAARFPGVTVLFDDNRVFDPLVRGGAGAMTVDLGRLLLMDGQEVRDHYLNTFAQPDHKAVTIAAAEAFVAGETPALSPIVPNTGEQIPADNLLLSGPLFTLWVNPQVAEAPLEPTGQGAHPGTNSRRVLTGLTPLLAEYGVQGVALSGDPNTDTALFAAEFPDWQLLVLATPEEQLRWTQTRALLIDSDKRIVSPLIVFEVTSAEMAQFASELEGVLRSLP
jgi:hypothetical protein